MEEIQELTATIVRRNNIHILGRGSEVMLLAHGFGCDQNMWRYIVPAFEADYRIVLFDYVGSGSSDLKSYFPSRYNSLHGYVQDVLEICGTLDLKEVTFVGHSVSSMIGLLAAIEQPAIFKRLVMIGPSPCYINESGYIGGFERSDVEGLLDTMEKNYIGWANFLAPAIIGNRDRPELGDELTASFCATDPEVAKDFAAVTFFSDNRADLHKLALPCLLLQCSEDMIAPTTVGQYLSDHIQNSTLKIMKATGHCPHLSAPEETIELMREFLNETT